MIINKKVVNREKNKINLKNKFISINISNPSIFNGIKIININNSNLEELKSGTFAGLESLESINLDNNVRLKIIEQNCFEGCKNLKIISLVYCALEELKSGTFAGLESLESINLNRDKNLHTIESRCFEECNKLKIINLSECNLRGLIIKDLTSLEVINLSHNDNLSIMEPGCFKGCTNLKIINLSECNLQVLESETFEGLHKELKINLTNNNLIYIDDTSSYKNLTYNFLNIRFPGVKNNDLLEPLIILLNNSKGSEENMKKITYYKYFIINKSGDLNIIIDYLLNQTDKLLQKNIFIIVSILLKRLLDINIFIKNKHSNTTIILSFIKHYLSRDKVNNIIENKIENKIKNITKKNYNKLMFKIIKILCIYYYYFNKDIYNKIDKYLNGNFNS
jgi:uncharacterized protein YuzB (UPF0349 family)